jgi:CRISPR-associated endonuclease Cas2
LTDFIAQRTADADQNESEKPGASVTSTLYVVVTNVRASERQQQVREILRFHGTEVRSCVYEVVASDTSIKRIQEELSYVLRPEDDVRIYRICENCRAASVVFGDSELASPPVAIIV